MEVRPPIFVFGSNLAGRHGAGAALHAVKHHGAVLGRGEGPQGDSYAIPTKDSQLRPLPLDRIGREIKWFLDYARDNGFLETEINCNRIFDVTRVGCGLAGYTDNDIKDFFLSAPYNCLLPKGWRRRPVVAVTGHRPDELSAKFNLMADDLFQSFFEEFEPCQAISGMALGIDQLFAISCNHARIPWLAAIPCNGQELKWSVEAQALYHLILRSSVASACLAPAYHPGVMQARNEWMVNHADILLAIYDGSLGGTHHCRNYALKQGVPVITMDPSRQPEGCKKLSQLDADTTALLWRWCREQRLEPVTGSSYVNGRLERWYATGSNLQSFLAGRAELIQGAEPPRWFDQFIKPYKDMDAFDSVLVCGSPTSIKPHRDHGHFDSRAIMINLGSAIFKYELNKKEYYCKLEDGGVYEINIKLVHSAEQTSDERFNITWRSIRPTYKQGSFIK